MWGKRYAEAKEIIDNLYNSLKRRNSKTDVTIRLSIDSYHINQVGMETYKNIIGIFEDYYHDNNNFHLKVHTIMSDDAIYKFASSNNYTISNVAYYNVSDNNKILKVVPKKFYLYTPRKYKIEVGAAKLFYPNVTPDLNSNINNNAVEVFDKDISDSETFNPAIVNNIKGSTGLDFWINYNGNVTTWQNEQFDNIMNIYNDNYSEIIKKTYNNLLSFSFIEKGYYHREKIISEINNRAILRSKLSNMRDLSTAMLLHESKTRLYYYIMIIKEYYNYLIIDKEKISDELIKTINLPKEDIIDLYQKSDYSIIDDYISDEVTKEELTDLFYVIKLGEYDINNKSIKRGISYLNKKSRKYYKKIDDIVFSNDYSRIDRIIEKLTRMEPKSHEKCLFYNGLQNNDLNLLRNISKSDLHAHATRSGSKEYFEKKYNTTIKTPESFKTIKEMNDWYDKEIKILFNNDLISFRERLKAAFLAAKKDNINKLCLSFGTGNIDIFNGDIDKYIKEIKKIKDKYYFGEFIPELCLVRGKINKKLVIDILDKKYFRSIDLVGDESLGVDDAVDIYKYSKKYNMIRRCHVGEFMNYKYIIEAIKKLDLHEIQHGISGIKNKETLDLIKNREIKVNLCPQSNLVFNNIEKFYEPLRKILNNNIKVSINTDDLLILDKTISEIYMDLYNTNEYTIDELNKIRVDNL